ncbi:MAG: GntR family transcriptional regulator [Chloroflexota bacterium]|nr:GntR family transcriptional regulator [Chloroflexota bacterium]
MLDKTSPIPLYYQLAETIKEQIAAGTWLPGTQLPGERELNEQYSISRMTVRQALQHLIREGIVVSKKGLGTYVAAPKMSYDPLHVMGFTDDMLRRGATVSSRVLEQVIVTLPTAIGAQLQLASSATATKIVRLRLSDSTPLLLETVYVPMEIFPNLVREDLAAQSLYHLLFERYNVQLKGSQQTFEAVPANENESNLFGINTLTPMFLIEGVTYDVHDRPIEYFKAAYRGDRFKIHLDSRRNTQQFDSTRSPLLSVVMR